MADTDPAKHHFVHNDIDIYYWEYGSPKRPPVILIHGFTGSHEGFQYITPLLRNYRVIVPDLPGFGESPLTLETFTIDTLAAYMNRFVTQLNLRTPPVLISHSMGTLVAAAMLQKSPKLFSKKTIFISPVATRVTLLDSRKLGELLGRLHYYAGYKLPVVGDLLVKNQLISRIMTWLLLTSDNADLRRDIYQHHFKNLDYISSSRYYHHLHKDINIRGVIDYADTLKKLDVCIIAGTADSVAPLATQKKLQLRLQATLRTIPGVGHLAHYETPETIVREIAAFLR